MSERSGTLYRETRLNSKRGNESSINGEKSIEKSSKPGKSSTDYDSAALLGQYMSADGALSKKIKDNRDIHVSDKPWLQMFNQKKNTEDEISIEQHSLQRTQQDSTILRTQMGHNY